MIGLPGGPLGYRGFDGCVGAAFPHGIGDHGNHGAPRPEVIAEHLHGQHCRNQVVVVDAAPFGGVIGQRVGARVAIVPLRDGDIDHCVQVRGELTVRRSDRARVGVVEHDHLAIAEFEVFGGNLEVIASAADEHHLVAGTAEALRDGAPQFGVATSDQNIHRRPLLSCTTLAPARADDVTGQ